MQPRDIFDDSDDLAEELLTAGQRTLATARCRTSAHDHLGRLVNRLGELSAGKQHRKPLSASRLQAPF